MITELHMSGRNHSAVSGITDSRQILTCCLSELRSCLGAGKKQPRVWLQYDRGASFKDALDCKIKIMVYVK